MQVSGRRRGLAGQDRAGPDGPAPVRGALTGGKAPGLCGAAGTARELRENTGPEGSPGACFPGSEWVRRRSRPRSPEPCAQVRILLGAQVKAYFSNLYSSTTSSPVRQLRPDSVNRPSTRRFMTRCHSTPPSNRLPASLLARDLRERFPLSEGSHRVAQLAGLPERAVPR